MLKETQTSIVSTDIDRIIDGFKRIRNRVEAIEDKLILLHNRVKAIEDYINGPG